MKVLKNSTTPSTAVCRWRRAWGCVSIGLAALLAGCGNIPNAKVSYQLATSVASVKVVRTVLCDAANFPVVFSTVTPGVSHRADSGQAKVLDLDWFRSPWSDADVKLERYDDGRLKAVNAATTGQGEAILKAMSTVASAIAGIAPLNAPTSFPAECGFIANQNSGKPISISYEGAVDPDKPKQRQDINPEAASAHYARNVKNAIGEVCAFVDVADKPAMPVDKIEGPGDRVVYARQPGWIDVKVYVASAADECKPAGQPLWSGRIPIAQAGIDYKIPIPRPAVFGKQAMGVAFAESGALSSLQYSSATGAAQGFGGLNSLLAMAQGDTAAQQLVAVKVEADLIAQQQRLVLCMARPADCPK